MSAREKDRLLKEVGHQNSQLRRLIEIIKARIAHSRDVLVQLRRALPSRSMGPDNSAR